MSAAAFSWWEAPLLDLDLTAAAAAAAALARTLTRAALSALLEALF